MASRRRILWSVNMKKRILIIFFLSMAFCFMFALLLGPQPYYDGEIVELFFESHSFWGESWEYSIVRPDGSDLLVLNAALFRGRREESRTLTQSELDAVKDIILSY